LDLRFKILIVVKMAVLIFWVLMPYRFVGGYQSFGGKTALISALNMEAVDPSQTILTYQQVDTASQLGRPTLKSSDFIKFISELNYY
jgi:hypothetical protein